MANIPSIEPQHRFSSYPNFKPFFSPRDMLELGVYGGNYFYWLSVKKDIPIELFSGLPISKYGVISANQANNYFNTPTIARAKPRVTIFTSNESPKGWFQWYAKFWYGNAKIERINLERIEQWKNDVKNLWSYVKDKPEDLTFRIDIRQALLEIAWNPTSDPNIFL